MDFIAGYTRRYTAYAFSIASEFSVLTSHQISAGRYDARLFVQQDSAMHLSRQTDARNLIAAQTALSQRLVDSDATCAPPVTRILLRPANSG